MTERRVKLFAALFAVLLATPVIASERDRETMSVSPNNLSPAGFTDFSSARRKRTTHTQTAPAAVSPAVPAWQGADPTRGPNSAQLRELQRQGRCVIDEGYGRYSSCSNE